MTRRLLAGSLILLLAIGAGAWAFAPKDAYKGRHMNAIVPPPTHIEWDTYPVEGMLLCRPAPDTTTTQVPCIRLPEGAMLAIPRLVGGEDPGKKKGQS